MFSLIFSLAFVFCALLALLFGFLTGKKYKWQYSTVKIVLTVISTIIATFSAFGLAWAVSSAVVHPMKRILETVSTDLAFLYSSEDILKAICAMIIGPVIFYPIFVIIRSLTSIAKKPLTRLFIHLTEKKKSESHESVVAAEDTVTDTEAQGEEAVEVQEATKTVSAKSKKQKDKDEFNTQKITPLSSILGAVCGFLTFIVICIPTVCGIACIAKPIASITEAMDDAQIVYDITDGASSNAATFTMKIVGGEAVYNRLTTYKVEGHKASLKNETQFVASFIGAIYQSNTASDDHDRALATQSFRKAGENFKKTSILPTLLPRFFSAADAKWSQGEKFIGISKPALGNTLTPITDRLFPVLSNETYDTAKEDIPDIINVLADVSEKYTLSTLKSSPMTVFGDDEVSYKVIKRLLDNDRLYVMIAGLSECGVNILNDKMDMHTDTDVIYWEMTSSLSTEISTFMSSNISESAISTCEDTPPEGGDAQQPEGSEQEKPQPEKQLSKKLANVFRNNGINITDESALALSLSAMESFNDQNATPQAVEAWLASKAITITEEDSTTQTVVIDSPASFSAHTQVVNVEEIQFSDKKVSDTDKEAKLLAQSFKQISEMFNKISEGEEMNVNSFLIDLGPALDSFRATETFGTKNTSILFTGILQSGKVSDKLKMPMTEIYDLACHINTSANSKSNYQVLLCGLSQTVTVLDASQGNDKAKTDAEVKQLLEDLTPESATTIQKISTPAVIESYGVPERSSEPTSTLISDVFGNLSNAKEEGNLTDEQYDAEAKAVSDMMGIAMNASSSNQKAMFGENSATGITAADFVDRVTDSTVVSGTFVDTVYGEGDTPKQNPLNSGKKLSEQEQADMLTAMNAKLAEAPEENKNDVAKQLISASAIINFSVELTADGIVAVQQ